MIATDKLVELPAQIDVAPLNTDAVGPEACGLAVPDSGKPITKPAPPPEVALLNAVGVAFTKFKSVGWQYTVP